MKKADLSLLAQRYVNENIHQFHDKRLEQLNRLKLKSVLKKKNPYLFRAKNMVDASTFVDSILSAFISSSEETIFGNWLENLAIYLNSEVYGGRKSSTTGMDLEFDKNKTRYLVSIKSGPNWGNSSQVNKMIDNFNAAKKVLKTSGGNVHVECVNGCCYGIDNNPYKSNGDYYKYCGQRFWEFISGEQDLYIEIIEPLGYKAKEQNDIFAAQYAGVKTLFLKAFIEEFCYTNGQINWALLIAYNSQATP